MPRSENRLSHLVSRAGLWLALATLALLAAACVEDNRPDEETCARQSVTLELRLAADTMQPDDPAVCRGQDVTLQIEVEQDGVLHVHGYDDAVPATAVTAGDSTTLRFTADRSGQFPVELHTTEEPQGVTVGIFTVHES